MSTYLYNQTKNYAYIASGQSLIWGKSHVGQTTTTRNRINTEVNNFNKNVKFNRTSITLWAGDSITITDANKVFNKDFTLTNRPDVEQRLGVKITVNGDRITISNPKTNTRNGDTRALNLSKFNNYFSKVAEYGLTSNTNQDLALLFSVPNITSKLNITVRYQDVPLP